MTRASFVNDLTVRGIGDGHIVVCQDDTFHAIDSLEAHVGGAARKDAVALQVEAGRVCGERGVRDVSSLRAGVYALVCENGTLDVFSRENRVQGPPDASAR